MTSIGKSPLKRFELPIHKFSKVALPLYIELLEKHQSNLIKFRANKEWERARLETMNAQRTVQQLKAAVEEMDCVRNQLSPDDRMEFDVKLEPHKNKAVDAIQKFIDISQVPRPTVDEPNYNQSSFDGEVVLGGHQQSFQQVDLLPEEISLEERKIQLETWQNLQHDMEELQELFTEFSKQVHTQASDVDSVEANAETALENVKQGERNLAIAAKYKSAIYPLTGALIGTCVGGPVGLLAGMKIGGLVAIGGSVLGFTGGRALKKWQEKKANDPETRVRSGSLGNNGGPPRLGVARKNSLSY